MLSKIPSALFLLLFSVLLSTPAQAEIAATSIYSTVEKSVYQIRVINKQTGDKSSIGSGFVVNKDNILATNYHVVSEYVNDPDLFRLEYLATDGKKGPLELIDFDIVHDLAVIKSKQPMGTPLSIDALPPKGATLFSLGNPMDLGFTIVKGSNNGILTKAEDGNILFSGSLNQGMSGGPTLNKEGHVIGVNVATSGNDISFLVAAKYLTVILDRLEGNNYKPVEDRFAHSAEQIRENSKKIVNKILNNKWSSKHIGNITVPERLDKSILCWDASRKPKKDDLLQSYLTTCSNRDNIYVSTSLNIGTINYDYTWLQTKDLSPTRFYRHYEKMNHSIIGSHANKRDVTNFSCHTDFTQVASQDFKTTVCRRDYIKYEGLSDMLFTTALVGKQDKGFLFNLDFTGTDSKTALKLFTRMLETFKWEK